VWGASGYRATFLGYVSRITKAIANATTMANISGHAAYCASSNVLGSIPASRPKPMRTPGRLIMIPPTMNIMPLTMAAEVPMRLGATVSAAVLKASCGPHCQPQMQSTEASQRLRRD